MMILFQNMKIIDFGTYFFLLYILRQIQKLSRNLSKLRVIFS